MYTFIPTGIINSNNITSFIHVLCLPIADCIEFNVLWELLCLLIIDVYVKPKLSKKKHFSSPTGSRTR